MASAVLDSSALLALLFAEPGAARVREVLAQSVISAVNFAEVVAKLSDRGVPMELGLEKLARLPIAIEPLDADTALEAGLLRQSTRPSGMTLADRACLALARRLGLPVLTADQAWAEEQLDVEIVVIR
jgi:PIN domain nuclease of toxin-antitoxin system